MVRGENQTFMALLDIDTQVTILQDLWKDQYPESRNGFDWI